MSGWVYLVVHDSHGGGAVPAHVHRAVGPLAAGARVQRPGAQLRHLRAVQPVVRAAHGL